ALQPLWIKIAYAIGMLSCVYHFANGLWTQGITWGLWTSAAAQRRASWVSVVVGVGLAVVGLSALVGMGEVNIEQARQVEDAMELQQDAIKNLEHAPAAPSAEAPSP